VVERGSQIVLGLDPHPARLWPVALEPRGGPHDPACDAGEDGMPADVRQRTAAAVARHCRAAIEAVADLCVAVKPQVACFERLGPPGWVALEATVAYGREHGLLVVADVKRGDVPVTARAYADALVGSTEGPYGVVPGLGVDAFTANPLLGRDALLPLVEAAQAAGAGVFCLVRTSNPGAAELQDAVTSEGPVHERLARMVHELGRTSVGDEGLSGVGAVCGATAPALLTRLRGLMPHAVFLLPGVGAQGGAVEALAAAFATHPAGGLVTASRSIVDAHEGSGTAPAAAARAAVERLRAGTWALAAGGG
jgi:orotidine-5'-phosphate decarboxylase